ATIRGAGEYLSLTQGTCPVADELTDTARVDQVHEVTATERVQGRVGQTPRQLSPRAGWDNRVPGADQDEPWGFDLAKPRAGVDGERQLRLFSIGRDLGARPLNVA